jgi:hypothetical protein
MAADPDNPLFRFTRDDTAAQNILRVDVQQAGPVAPPSWVPSWSTWHSPSQVDFLPSC